MTAFKPKGVAKRRTISNHRQIAEQIRDEKRMNDRTTYEARQRAAEERRELQEEQAAGILAAVFALATGQASLIIDRDGDRMVVSVQHPPGE